MHEGSFKSGLWAKEAALAEGLNAHAEAAGGVEAQAVLGLHLAASLPSGQISDHFNTFNLPLSVAIHNMYKLRAALHRSRERLW